MAINKKLVHFKTFAKFQEALDANNILDTSIVFILDTQQIYTHKKLYDCKPEVLASLTNDGLLSKEDYKKLNDLPNNAQFITALNTLKLEVGSHTINGKMISTNPSLIKADVGLGNVDNTSDINKPISTALQAALDLKANVEDLSNVLAIDLEEEIDTGKKVQLKERDTDTDIFPMTHGECVLDYDGNNILDVISGHEASDLHIPNGGHKNQILTWAANGKAKWDNISNIFTGLEEVLGYGVEWDVTVADPHLTRIGNISLHKTLPIQSLLKGCIAQGDLIMYWLDENDWRFRKEPFYAKVENARSNLLYFEEENFAETLTEGLLIRVTTEFNATYVGEIEYCGDQEAGIIWEEEPDTWWADLPITKVEIGSRLDGYDGTVRVYCPEFYIKSEIDGNKRRVWLSAFKIDDTWTHQPEILIDAYRCTILNEVPKNMGYLSTLPVNSAISVVNTSAYCRGGGNRTNCDQYLDSDIFKTDLGKPRTSRLRSIMRTNARSADSEMLSYDLYKNIFYWLYVVEYANFNCQESYNATLTTEGYRLGGLGPGVTQILNWESFNNQYPITPCGYGNDLGNRTGVKLINSPALYSIIPVYMCRWRGFDNPFGDICTNLDGIIIDVGAFDEDAMIHVYTCQDPEKYADNLNGDGYELVGKEIYTSGYIKQFDLGDTAHIIPNSIGGSSTTFKCDGHFTDTNNSAILRTLLVGGGADYNVSAGLGRFDSATGVMYSKSYVGFRSVSRSVSPLK